jgi:hypothetical protein
MITRIVELSSLYQRTRQIRARVQVILSQWGLLPKFSRWKLTQDPESGLVVLFAVLNKKYIATHTMTPFSDYFDPRLLRDLANNLHMQVVSCNSDGLRYAFILDRGQIDVLPTHIDLPILEGDRLFVRVVYKDTPVPEVTEPQTMSAPLIAANIVDNHTQVHRGVEALLKVFDDIKLRDDAALRLSAEGLPGILVVEESEFNKRVAEHEAIRKRTA